MRIGRIISALALTGAFFIQALGTAVAGTTGTIQGTVTEGSGKTPLAGVTVTASAPSGKQIVKTDAKGFYSMLGLIPDTYTVSFELQGYEPQDISGVTVFADESVPLQVAMTKSLKTIAHTVSHAVNSAFQPNNPHDTYTVTSKDIVNTLGTSLDDSATQLFTSLPGVTSAGQQGGVPVVRGGRANTIGYTLQGAPTTNAYNSSFGAAQEQDTAYKGDVLDTIPTLALQELQLTPGVADASYGDAGTGNINLVFKQGTYPSFFDFTAGVGGNGFDHAIDTEYGVASPNGRYAAYFMYHGENTYTNWGNGANSQQVGSYAFPGLTLDRTALVNLTYKFGKNNKYALQLFGLNEYDSLADDFGTNANLYCVTTCGHPAIGSNFGGICGYFFTDWTADAAGSLGIPQPAGFTPVTSPVTGYQEMPYCQAMLAPQEGQLPGQTQDSLVQANLPYNAQSYPHYNEELTFTDNLSSNAFLTTRFYHSGGYQTDDQASNQGGGAYYYAKGGYQDGITADLSLQAGSKNLIGAGVGREYQHPSNDLNYPLWGPEIVFFDNITEGFDFIPPNYGNTGVGCGLNVFYLDFYHESFVPAQNYCGYLPNALGRANSPVVIPPNQVETNINPHYTNLYLKDTWRPTDNVTVDAGVRVDHAQYDLPPAAVDLATCTSLYMPLTYSPPTDANGNYLSVVPGKQCQNETFASISAANTPTVVQPRFGLSWRLGNNDAVKVSYGRSFSWAPVQTMDSGDTTSSVFPQGASVASYFSPGTYCLDNLAGISSAYNIGVPSVSDPNCQSAAAMSAAFSPGTSIPFYSYFNPWPCGGGPMPACPGTNKTDPNWPLPPAGQPNPTGAPGCGLAPIVSPCLNYEEQLQWEYANDYASTGGTNFRSGILQPVLPAVFTNEEVGWNHNFPNGVGPKWLRNWTQDTGLALTVWKRNGADESIQETLPIPYLPQTAGTPPVLYSGAQTNNGVDLASGIEMRITRQRDVGLSLQYSMTYQHALTNTPPTNNQYAALYAPSISGAAVAINQLFPTAYISPFTMSTSVSYKWKSGWRIGLENNWAKGYPVGAGLYSAQYVDGVAKFVPISNAAPGPVGSTQFVDPFNPGNILKPNIAATTGTHETYATFGALGPAESFTNVQLEKELSRVVTFGVNVSNVFGYTASGAVLNAYYQPVATGISGPKSGANIATNGGVPVYSGANPYINPPWAVGRSYYVYLTLKAL